MFRFAPSLSGYVICMRLLIVLLLTGILLGSCQDDEIEMLEAKREKAKYEYDSTLNEHYRLLRVTDSLVHITDSLSQEYNAIHSRLMEAIKRYNK